ncbi:hypothetical protein OHT57_15430 [Streptomyces sp. NBC_00285]|uniref:SCO2400 family protein n=1 Tax=Streptomyces sp. NBC_00285 TaxID=2975700 RepID=UPI002E2C6B4A|nr:hypothetical protein [Streptomyces sp. NBC_00285]
MDYCNPCRRHLNGALACPGCGTSIEALRAYPAQLYIPAQAQPPSLPQQAYAAYGTEGQYGGAGDPHGGAYAGHEAGIAAATGGYGGQDAPGAYDAGTDASYGGEADTDARSDAGDSLAETVEPTGGRASRRRARGRADRVGADAGSHDVSGAPEGDHGHDDEYDEDDPDAAEGGASRRDRKAAAHRRRRRRTLLIVTGFVLAAGGLSLAELGMDAPGSSPKPAAAGGESAEGGASPQASESDSAAAHSSGTVPSGSPSPTDSTSPSASASKSEDDRVKDAEKAAQSASAAAPGGPGATPTSTATGGASTPSADPTTADPTPAPSASCARFLWWCT